MYIVYVDKQPIRNIHGEILRVVDIPSAIQLLKQNNIYTASVVDEETDAIELDMQYVTPST